MCGDWSSGVDEEQPATVAAKKNNNIVKVNSAFVAAKKQPSDNQNLSPLSFFPVSSMHKFDQDCFSFLEDTLMESYGLQVRKQRRQNQ